MRERGNGCAAGDASDVDDVGDDDLAAAADAWIEEEGAVKVDRMPSVVSRVRR